ncbi:hypothetical protein [Teredinibacter waterburyi]|uniref:hypothetical protein n=1 Tax=Teredinibacter waterburyi TaxID=1500538 RepID=UPI00165F1BFB|nr:hypothetical protein [Teredinibacter waterburyi]
MPTKRLAQLLFMAIAACLFSACSKSEDSELAIESLAPSEKPAAQIKAESANRVSELMEVSGFNDQILQMQSGVLASADQSLAADLADRYTVLDILSKAFSPAFLQAEAQRHIERELSSADVTAALAWLQSETGQTITALEMQYANAEAQQAAAEAFRDLSKNTERLQLVGRLDDEIGGTASSVDVMLSVQNSMKQALNAKADSGSELAVLSEQQLAEQATLLVDQFRPLVEASYLYNYRSLTVEQLQSYIDFAATESARRYHAVLADSIKRAMSAAAGNAGLAISEMAR